MKQKLPVFLINTGSFLFPIISYQVMTGNYSKEEERIKKQQIISYQVMTGNYSMRRESHSAGTIISYQVMTGNYSFALRIVSAFASYHTK